MAGERTFLLRFLADTSQTKAALKLVSGDLKGFGKEITKTVPGFAAIAVGATAAFGAVAAGVTKAVQAAMEDQKSQAELQRQLEKTFGANEALNASAERYISITQLRTGTSDTELRASLGTLVRATGDYQQSLGLLNTAQDISAATGKDLASVSIALAKGSQGQFTALSRLGIPIDEATKKSKDFTKVLSDLNGQFGGAAATSANTFGGQLKIIKGQFGEIMETIGTALLPYLQKFTDFLVKNVAPAVQRITTVVGEKGLVGGFQQLLFESGGAGAAIVAAFKGVAVAVATATNAVYKFYYLAKAGAEAILNPVQAAKDAYKGLTGEAIDIGKLKSSFDAIAIPVNNYKLSLRDAINQQTNFKGSVEDIQDPMAKTGKALKTATEKLKSYSDALKSNASAQKSFSNAQKDTASATKSKAEADAAVAKAQARLDQVSAGFGAGSPEALAAQSELAKAQRAQERATFAVEEAIYSVADAEMNLAKVRQDPESSPMDVRRAELGLAEAKLSVSDATDSQIASTSELNDKQTILNETIYGATIGSLVYDEALQAVNDAKDRQSAAAEALADAIDKEREAQDKLNESIQTTIDLMAKYPKVLGGMPNPMGGMVGQPANTVGAAAFTTRSGDTYAININAAIADQGLPALVVDALKTYNKTVGKIPVITK